MSRALLSLSGVSKSYNLGAANEIRVLRDIDLDLHAGETVALVAPSGAGKSTLLHIAGLLDSADQGDVILAEHVMNDQSEQARTLARRRQLGFIYQFHHLLPEFSAAENIVLPQLANGVSKTNAKKRALELLNDVGIKDRADHRPAQLSGGEQQRVAFCRALANQPHVLLADEPTGNLDPATSDKVFDALLDLVRNSGMAALIATHNMALAGRMDRQVWLEAGKLVGVSQENVRPAP